MFSAVDAREVLLVLDPGHGGYDQGGWSGDGFRLGDRFVPEDAYTYDIAKRVEMRAKENGWSVAFTVRDIKQKECILDSDENTILPPRDTLIFNLSPPYRTVRSGREGLERRVRITKNLARSFPDAVKIFVSIHIDLAKPFVQGIQTFTVPEAHSLALARSIADFAKLRGLEFSVRGKIFPAINSRRHLFVLRRGVLAPRVLIEVGNFYNPRDQRLALRSSGREQYADIIVSAIEKYLRNR